MPLRPRGLAVTLAIAALVATGCSPDKTQISPTAAPTDGDTVEVGPSAEATAPTSGDRPAVYEQEVSWSACDELECATIQVPLDWSDPHGATIDLAINRHVAREADQRIGSLLFNPGGPGGSGLDFTESIVARAGDDLVDAYDIVGFDPRGVGQSSGVVCGSDAQIDAFYLQDRFVETEAQAQADRERVADFAALCEADTGPLIRNIDTVSAARDMDVIRAVVGDEQLHYIGFSYGTWLGAVYAELYPENVGRVVLDAVADFTRPAENVALEQARGFEDALTSFLTWCLGRSECALTGTVEQARATVQSLLAEAEADPMFTGFDLDLNRNLMETGMISTLYDEAAWEYLNIGLEEVLEQRTGAILFQLANFYLDRDADTGEYLANQTWFFTAINCLDAPEEKPWSIEEIDDFRDLMEQASPTFGRSFVSDTGCEGWPWHADQIITTLDNAATAPQMLVVGTTGDPATPLAWSEDMADRLGAEMVVYEGEGHTAYGRSNQCVTDAVDGFLVDGVMPNSGTRC